MSKMRFLGLEKLFPGEKNFKKVVFIHATGRPSATFCRGTGIVTIDVRALEIFAEKMRQEKKRQKRIVSP